MKALLGTTCGIIPQKVRENSALKNQNSHQLALCFLSPRGLPINAPPAPPCHGHALTRVFGLVSSCCARAVNESTCIGLDKTSG
jgi:hypothetical protein